MTDSPDDLSAHDDQQLAEWLSPLRVIGPSPAAQLVIREAAADELASYATSGPAGPWWQRSVAVPVPIAAASLVVLALLETTVVLQASNAPAVTQSPPPAAEPTKQRSAPDHIASLPPELEYRERQVYVCGIGRLTSQSGYVPQE